MISFDKKDIPALNFIINECLKNESKSIIANDLIKNGFLTKEKGYSSLLYLDEYKEFERLMFIIRQYDCAKTRFVSEKEANIVSSVSKNIKTSQFKSQGSFKKAYKDLKKPLDWYKIIPIILTIFFGLLSAYFLKANYDLKVNESNQTKKYDVLKGDFSIYKDSLVEAKEQINLLKLKPSKTK